MAYVPVLAPTEELLDEFWDLLDELEELPSKIDTSHFERNWSNLTFRVLDGPDQSQATNKVDRAFFAIWGRSEQGRAGHILKISVNAAFLRADALEALRGWRTSKETKVKAYKRFLAYDIPELVHDLLLVANIARPGVFEIGGCYVFQDNRLNHVDTAKTLISDLELVRNRATEISWPTIQVLRLADVWKWAAANDLFGRLGTSPLGRAFNAFSYLFGEPLAHEAPKLFWALLGIEALYVTSTTRVMEQVRERTQLVLGPIAAYKKKLSRMYDVRSSFIHGALSFPGQFFTSNALPEYEEYMNKLTAASDLAQAILLATLQQMVVNEWGQLRFKTVLEPGRIEVASSVSTESNQIG